MEKINIIDPSSSEVNRGSFCYAPYLLYNYLKEEGYDVILYESFACEHLDTLRPADITVCTLWSYPQIPAALFINENLEDVSFLGYSGIISHAGVKGTYFADFLSDADKLKKAMAAYPKYYKDFDRLLLSDCDMHIQELDSGEKVYPMFTTYGCPNNCAFCPTSVNCRRRRISLDTETILQMFDACIEQGIRCIHLTDEDFFLVAKQAHEVLCGLKGKGLRLICLGSAGGVFAYIQEYGTDAIKEAGLEIIEIGFESGDANMSNSMGSGKDLSLCEKLAKMEHLPFKIFWLVLTFFPGETIESLRKTGEFMIRHGMQMNEVVGRLRTNGTVGGLGQYFQPYHGTELFAKLEKEGTFLTHTFVRLLPSWVPTTLTKQYLQWDKSTITEIYQAMQYLREWAVVYNISEEEIETFEKAVNSRIYIGRYLGIVDEKPNGYLVVAKRAILVALAARLQILMHT